MRIVAVVIAALVIGFLAATAHDVPDPIHRPNTVGSFR